MIIHNRKHHTKNFFVIDQDLANNINSCNNTEIKNNNFKYFSEILLITNTKDLYNIIDFFVYHLYILKFDHIIVVDNGAADGFKDVCKMFGNKISYNYDVDSHEQVYLLNKYLKTSEAHWTVYIDDDEYIVLKQHDNINTFLKDTIINLDKQYYKFSINFVHFFGKDVILDNKNNESYLTLFNYINPVEPISLSNDATLAYVKSFINNEVLHTYYNANIGSPIKCVLNDDSTVKYFDKLDYADFRSNINAYKSNCATGHNPLTMINNKIFPSYNLSNRKEIYGCFSCNNDGFKNAMINTAYLAHFKYRTVDEYKKKIKYNKFADVENSYYDATYKLDAYYNIYNILKNNFIKNNDLFIIYNNNKQLFDSYRKKLK